MRHLALMKFQKELQCEQVLFRNTHQSLEPQDLPQSALIASSAPPVSAGNAPRLQHFLVSLRWGCSSQQMEHYLSDNACALSFAQDLLRSSAQEHQSERVQEWKQQLRCRNPPAWCLWFPSLRTPSMGGVHRWFQRLAQFLEEQP